MVDIFSDRLSKRQEMSDRPTDGGIPDALHLVRCVQLFRAFLRLEVGWLGHFNPPERSSPLVGVKAR